MAAVQAAFLSGDTPQVVMRKFGSEPWFEPDFHEPDRGQVQDRFSVRLSSNALNAFERNTNQGSHIVSIQLM
jgi:hypothetical protein